MKMLWYEIFVLLCDVKKITRSNTYRIVSASLLLLLISVSILPLNLFHHHHSTHTVHCLNNSSKTDIDPAQKEDVFLIVQLEDRYEECLFCTWQMGVKLTYVIPEIVVFLPDFVKNKLAASYFTSVELIAVAEIPNKGPPAFLLF